MRVHNVNLRVSNAARRTIQRVESATAQFMYHPLTASASPSKTVAEYNSVGRLLFIDVMFADQLFSGMMQGPIGNWL